MHLKRISMAGFKSFADKVDFEFGPGVTGIVGPNGCGKSNVVDAFKWVLGEQSAKSLRGRQMLDMIFNGSSARRSSSLAQVEMVFDNTDRTLPVDRDEVNITRKLFRSGESEYLICKEPARLKDVRELFMDTGIGFNAYAVIEQGKVDVLLQSSSTERRIIFEEAAGISKYKARKREAERKLERTDQNLLRVADIIEEVERRLRSVKLQAGKARNFQQYDARLRELRASYSMAEYHRLTVSLRAIKAEVDAATDQAAGLRTAATQAETETAQLQTRTDRLTESIAVLDNRLVNVRAEVATQQERADAARSRIGEQEANLHRAEARYEQERVRCDQHVAELAAVEQQAAALEAQAREQDENIRQFSAAEQDLARKLTQTQAVLEDEKAGVVDLLRRSAQLHNEIIALTRHSDSLSDQKGRLAVRDAAIAEELHGHLERKGDLEGKLREVEQLVETERTRLEEKKRAAERIDAERARLVETLAQEKESRSALRSRHQVLADLQRKMEGVGAGVRQILDRKRLEAESGALACVLGLVADFFDTDVPRAAIVEAAVGDRAQDLVVTDSRALLADPQVLDGLRERATAVCLDRLPPVVNVRDFADQPGFVAPALSFVRYPESLELLARNLLGKTIIVDTLVNALAMAELDDEHHRFVTLRGEVVEADGCVRVGPPHRSTGLISRKTELRLLEQQLAAADERIERLADDLNRTAAQATHLEQVQQELRTAIYELHTARVETNAALSNVSDALRRLTAEKPLIAGEVTSLEQQIAEAHARSSANRSSLVTLEADSQAREAQVRQLQARIDELTAQRQETTERLTLARVAAGQLAEKRAATAETMNALRRGIHAAEEAVAAAAAEMADCRERIEESQRTIRLCAQKRGELEGEARRIEAEVGELRGQRETLRARMEELAADLKRIRGELATVEQQLHEMQLALHEAGIRRDELAARVKDSLGLDLAVLYEGYQHTEQDWAAVEAEIAELKQKIERLGNINLDAIKEQEELEERLAFLTAQRDDLETSRRQLDALITELNAESKERFIEAFNAIRDNFRELYRKLFGGGKADIVLENPDDVLECGIEILARPPGKETQSITLLSGGEKSMTAIALLMAIFRSRPSPCAILDEVDAALDEANNDRFASIIREFLDRSQFIVITHSKRSMIIADRLYGITMQEPGVSTRVSVKFDQADDQASAVA